MKKHIKAFVMDVDGTLTDGGIYMGDNGELFKRFHVKDGYGIGRILPKHHVIPIIVTGRVSKIIERRCSELGINIIMQGATNKVDSLYRISMEQGIDFSEMAFIGDDLNDMEAMSLVAIKGCPSDAAEQILYISDFVSDKPGGCGAVRDFIDWLSVNGYFAS